MMTEMMSEENTEQQQKNATKLMSIMNILNCFFLPHSTLKQPVINHYQLLSTIINLQLKTLLSENFKI